jgi:putative ABC transport system permease protein
MLRNTWWLREKTLDFKSRLLQIPGIESASCTDYFPTPSSRSNTTFTKAGMDVATASISSQHWTVDFDYLQTFGLKLQEGRWFDPALKTDSTVCVINQAAAKAFGWPNPVGQKISSFTNPTLKETRTMEIVGVVQDFNYESLRENIGPMVISIGDGSGTMALRIAAKADIEKTMAAVGAIFKTALPAQPFNFKFVDEEFDQEYRVEQRIGSILGAFAGFAIFIACLGLFGLASFTAEQRTKEIGIRKVLGASVAGITGLLAKDFLKLVIVSVVLASPVAYYFMQRWLADFAYRIDIHWWMFVAAALAAASIAFLTVGFQSVRAALANPVKSLRSE